MNKRTIIYVLWTVLFLLTVAGTVYASTFEFKGFIFETDGSLVSVDYVYAKPWWVLKFKVTGASYVKIYLPTGYGKPLNVIHEDIMLAASWQYNSAEKTVTVYCSTGTYGVYWGYAGDVAQDPPNALADTLVSGSFIDFVISTYTSLLGEAFWIFPYLIIFVPLYIKTESIEYCSIVFILLSSFFLSVFPAEAGTVAAIFLVIGVSLLFYRLAAQAFKGV